MNNKLNLLKRDFIKEKKLVILSLTKRCNLLCTYCRSSKSWYDSLSQFVDDVDLSKENWPKIKEFYFSNNTKKSRLILSVIYLLQIEDHLLNQIVFEALSFWFFDFWF